MATDLLERVKEQLRGLSQQKLRAVAEFVDFVSARQEASDVDLAMRLSQDALRQLWDHPEEDGAWADL